MASEGKKIIALVTGGYKNLGLFITRQLMEDGYRVISTYRTGSRQAEKAQVWTRTIELIPEVSKVSLVQAVPQPATQKA